MAVATDYVCIPFWKETNPDYFIIPSEDLIDDFVSKGIKKEIRIRSIKKNILILTGSMGFGNITDMIEELLKNIKEVSFIISTGNNSKMLNVLKTKI